MYELPFKQYHHTLMHLKISIVDHITVKMEELTFNIMESGLEQYKDQWSADKGG